MDREQFIQRANDKYDNRFSYGEYAGQHKKIMVTCDRHNLTFETTPTNHLTSKYGCCNLCQGETSFIINSRKRYGDKYQYGVYWGLYQPIVVTCPRHGEMTMLPSGHIRNDGCKKCTFEAKFLQRAHKQHGDKFKYGVYHDWDTEVDVICPTHGPITTSPSVHLRSKTGCNQCNAPSRPRKTTEQYITEANAKHNNKYTYGEYEHIKAYIDVFCPEHGKFSITADSHLRGAGCAKCAGNVPITRDEFIKKGNKLYNNRFDYSKVSFTYGSDIVTITCPSHGDFDVMVRYHMKGSECKSCTGRLPVTFDLMKEKCNKIHNNLYTYHEDSYDGYRSKMKITCPHHGDFYQLLANHMNKEQSCPKCSAGNNSKMEREYLDSLGIPNDVEHRQVRLRVAGSKRGFVVDGFDPETKTIYEFDGDYWHGNPAYYNPEDINPRSKKTFGELYEQTCLKKKLLEDAGYTVISIWESEWCNNATYHTRKGKRQE